MTWQWRLRDRAPYSSTRYRRVYNIGFTPLRGIALQTLINHAVICKTSAMLGMPVNISVRLSSHNIVATKNPQQEGWKDPSAAWSTCRAVHNDQLPPWFALLLSLLSSWLPFGRPWPFARSLLDRLAHMLAMAAKGSTFGL